MRRNLIAIGIAFLACTALLFAATVYTFLRIDIYLGSKDKFSSPCIVEIQKVYDQLPSYQEAMKHPEGSAKRLHGLKKASDEFREIIAKVAKEKKYDLVAEKGSLTAHDSVTKKPIEIPDITTESIKAIPSK